MKVLSCRAKSRADSVEGSVKRRLRSRLDDDSGH